MSQEWYQSQTPLGKVFFETYQAGRQAGIGKNVMPKIDKGELCCDTHWYIGHGHKATLAMLTYEWDQRD